MLFIEDISNCKYLHIILSSYSIKLNFCNMAFYVVNLELDEETVK